MQTSTTTDKVSLPRRWMQPTAVMLWVLIWQLAAMAMNIPLLLPSPVAVLQRLWQLCGEGEFWYTVLTSLCRILLGFAAGVASRCFAGGSSVAMAVCAGDGPSDGRGAQIHSGRLLYHSGVGVGQNRAAGDPHLLYHGAAAGLQQSLSGDCCRGPEAVGDGKGVRAFRLENLPLLLSAGNPAFFLSAVSSALGLAWKSGIAAEVLGRPLTAIGTKIYESKVYLETADLFAWTLVIILLSVALERLLLWVTDRVQKRRKGGERDAAV